MEILSDCPFPGNVMDVNGVSVLQYFQKNIKYRRRSPCTVTPAFLEEDNNDDDVITPFDVGTAVFSDLVPAFIELFLSSSTKGAPEQTERGQKQEEERCFRTVIAPLWGKERTFQEISHFLPPDSRALRRKEENRVGGDS